MMTQDFLDGMLIVMIPSMLTLAWLIWRTPSDEHLSDESDFPARWRGR